MHHHSAEFLPLNIALLTVSDTRSLAEDKSGDFLQAAIAAAGHKLASRELIRDDLYRIRARAATQIAADDVHVLIITGGTGFYARDVTPDAVSCLFDKEVTGFGEMFRAVSREEIGMATIQSRAVAGLANRTLVVCLPGSTNACRTAWEKILCAQLDARTRPCSFVRLLTEQ
ncbi:MAG: molybdenum cofactor biosynthesis protein B [Neisseria sp.]|nr:molybdenum cofactor biosynthesis protein B [Neisseria sp.]